MIKDLASLIRLVGMVISGFIALIYLFSDFHLGSFLLAIVFAGIGCFASWVVGLLLTGFGELIELQHDQLEVMIEIKEKLDKD